MRLNSSETSLVIAGAWNPAILTPEWVIQHCMQAAGQQVRVQAAIPATVGGGFEFPRFTLPGFTYSSRPDALVITPEGADQASFAAAENFALRAVETLQHTPIAGLGHNFDFVDEAPVPAWLDCFTQAQQDLSDHAPAGWNVEASSLGTAFQVENTTVNIRRGFRAGKLTVKFNFHHAVHSAIECANELRQVNDGSPMYRNFELARQLLTNIYGRIEDDEHQPQAD